MNPAKRHRGLSRDGFAHVSAMAKEIPMLSGSLATWLFASEAEYHWRVCWQAETIKLIIVSETWEAEALKS